MTNRNDRSEQREQWSVSTTRSTKATNRKAIVFEKADRPGAPLRNRTVDLLLTISTARRPRRSACTDALPCLLRMPRGPRKLQAPGPRLVPRLAAGNTAALVTVSDRGRRNLGYRVNAI